jgi:hypothetical protein
MGVGILLVGEMIDEPPAARVEDAAEEVRSHRITRPTTRSAQAPSPCDRVEVPTALLLEYRAADPADYLDKGFARGAPNRLT